MSEDCNDLVEKIERALIESERLKEAGDYVSALQTLIDAVFKRFFGNTAGHCEPLVVDMLAVEKLADLATLFGEPEAADDLLCSLAAQYTAAGNAYYSFYIEIKRVHLAMASDLDAAYEILKGVVPEVETIQITPVGLAQWEMERFGSLVESGYETDGARTGRAIWRNSHNDQPITVIGDAGYGPDGRTYVWIQESSTAIPTDEVLFNTLLSVTGNDRVLLLACIYLEMGRILLGFGQYGNAAIILEQGLLITGTAPPSFIQSVKLQLRLALAEAHMKKGEMVRAQTVLLEFRTSINEVRYPGLAVRADELLGKIDLLTGKFGAALEKFESILQRCQKYRLGNAATVAAINLAHAMIYLNQTSEARAILGKVRALALKHNDEAVAARADYLIDVARARGRSLVDGVPIAPSITKLWNGSTTTHSAQKSQLNPLDLPAANDHLAFFEDRVLGFHWHLGSSDFEATGHYLKDITEVFSTSDSMLIKERLRLMSGMLSYYKGNIKDAEVIFNEGRTLLSDEGLLPELWQAQRFLGWCWEKQRRDKEKVLALAEETQEILNQMTTSLPQAHQAVFNLNKWTAEEEYIAREINQLADIKAESIRARWPRRSMLRWKMMRRLHKLLIHIDRYKASVVNKAVSADGRHKGESRSDSLIRALLRHPRDRHTIAFLVLPDRVFVASVGWLSLDFGVSPLTRLQVREAIVNWHTLMVSSGIYRNFTGYRNLTAASLTVNPSQYAKRSEQQRELATRLAEALQIPAIIETLPDRVQALTIVPDDSLHGFPFATFIHNGQYLIEKYALSISRTILGGEARQEQSPDESLIVGVSKGAQSEEFQVRSLPNVIPEIKLIKELLAKRWRKVNCLSDFDEHDVAVSKAGVLEQLPSMGLVHIASHGFFTPDQPDHSGLVIVRDGEVEILSLRELSSLNLMRTCHITLSACSLADACILPGRWIISLPETLLSAGAGSVLGILWPVNDGVAAEIMMRFYKNLEDLPRDRALQKAINECVKGKFSVTGVVDVTDPLHWAGYYLYGDAGHL